MRKDIEPAKPRAGLRVKEVKTTADDKRNSMVLIPWFTEISPIRFVDFLLKHV